MFKILVPLLMFLPIAGRAGLSIPMVDLSSHVPGAVSMIAVWSGTNTTISAGTNVSLDFPTGWTVPAVNVAGCACIFLKHTQTGTGSGVGVFSTNEVTVTAGSLSGNSLTLTMPKDLAPGPFYIRLDDFVGVPNPAQAGSATLTVSLNSVKTESKPVFFANGVQSTPGEITGLVSDAGKPVQGALVLVSTDTFLMDQAPLLEIGPAAGTVTAKPVGLQRLMAVTGVNGRYTLKVPFNGTTTYNVAALYGTSAQGSNVNFLSNVATVDIDSITTQTVNLSTFNTCANN